MSTDFTALTRNAQHGKRARYIGNPAAGIKGCRCPECSEANRVYHANLNARKRAIQQAARDAVALEQAKEKIRIANAQQGNRPEPEVRFPAPQPEVYTRAPAQVSEVIRDIKQAVSAVMPTPVPPPIQPAPGQPVCGICQAPAYYAAGNWYRCEQHKWK